MRKRTNGHERGHPIDFEGSTTEEVLRMYERVIGPLAHGDHLFVRYVSDYRLTGVVEIRGEVARPGTFPVRSGGTAPLISPL